MVIQFDVESIERYKSMKKGMSFSKVVTVLTATAIAGGVYAIDLPVPGDDGKIVLSEGNGTYVATDSVTCNQVVFGANNITLDLSADGGRVISIPSTVTTDGFSFLGRFTANVLGGSWDFGGKASLKVGSGSNHNVSILFNGTKVRNVNEVQIGANRRNCTLSLTDTAELDATSLRIANGSTSDHCTLEVLSGSKVSVADKFIPDDGSTIGSGYNVLKIDGAESSVSAPQADVTLGRGCSGDRITILNNGCALFKSLIVGGSSSTSYATNTVLTVDGATLSLAEALTIGKNGSYGNRAEFRDASISVGSITVGDGPNSTNNTLVLAGNTAIRQTTANADPFFFGSSGDNEVVLTDGFQYAPTADKLMVTSGNNTIRIRNGAKVTKNEGIWYFGGSSSCNTYSVEDGGTTVVYRVNFSGKQNKIVVFNGVFEVLRKNVDSDNAMIVGADSDNNPAIGCELVLSGTRPQYLCKGETRVHGNGKGVLRFVLPGAALETVPMSCGMVTVDEGASIHVACEDYLSWLGTDRASIVLAVANRKASPHMTVPESVLTAANAELPERCKLVVDGQELILKIARIKGTVVSIR